MGYTTRVSNLDEVITYLNNLEFRPMNEFVEVPALDQLDSILLLTGDNSTRRTSMDAFMAYLNSHLKNFICWKPVLTNNGFTWERSSDDESPGEIVLSDIIFPMASITQNGMISKDMFEMLANLDPSNIVYNDTLTTALKLKSDINHVHENYAVLSDIPVNISDLLNDANYITIDDIPTKISSFENDKKYLTVDTLPNASAENAGLLSADFYQRISNFNDTVSTLNTTMDNKVNKSDLSSSVLNICDTNGYLTETTLEIPIMSEENVGGAKINDSSSLCIENNVINIKPFGVTNLVKNGDFALYWSNKVPRGWEKTSSDELDKTTFLTVIDELSNFKHYLKLITGNGYGVKQLISDKFNDCTLTFYAKAEYERPITITIGGVSKDVIVGQDWMKYTVYFNNFNQMIEKYLIFKCNDNYDETAIYIHNVKCVIGNVNVDCARGYDDIIPPHLLPMADAQTPGVVTPDDVTIYINNGKLSSKITNDTINEIISQISKYSEINIDFQTVINTPILIKTAQYDLVLTRIDFVINDVSDSLILEIANADKTLSTGNIDLSGVSGNIIIITKLNFKKDSPILLHSPNFPTIGNLRITMYWE